MKTPSAILLSFAIGDALGMPFENDKPFSDKLQAWDGKTYHGSEYHKLNPGDTTDDTGMTLALAHSLIECDGYNPENVVLHYLDWYKDNPAGGIGGTIKKAMQRLEKKHTWYTSGIHLEPGMAGNGPAMRIVPLAIFHGIKNIIKLKSEDRFKRSDLLRKDVYFDSIITHKHSSDLTFESTYFYAKYLYDIMITDRKPFIELNLEKIENAELSKAIESFISFYQRKDADKDEAILEQLIEYNGFNIVATVCSAMFCAERYKDDLLKGLNAAIRSGGDTDTKAALTGALIGAKVGLKGIPKELIFGLNSYHQVIGTEALLIDVAART